MGSCAREPLARHEEQVNSAVARPDYGDFHIAHHRLGLQDRRSPWPIRLVERDLQGSGLSLLHLDHVFPNRMVATLAKRHLRPVFLSIKFGAPELRADGSGDGKEGC